MALEASLLLFSVCAIGNTKSEDGFRGLSAVGKGRYTESVGSTL